MKYSYFLCLLLAVTTNALASRSIIVLGGGGESIQKQDTLFDGALNNLSNYFQQPENRWDETTISFDGGHPVTEAIINSKFTGAQTAQFTEANYNSIVKKYIEKIETMNKGDQLLIMLDSHGAEKSSATPELTHQLAVSSSQGENNLNDLSKTVNISLDNLKTLSNLALKKGVNLAIIDFSCHSGNSLSLANSQTCVISSTGPKHFSYANFSDAFIKNMKKGQSLEDVFLTTRKSDNMPTYPMISTPEGMSITQDFYEALRPYLYSYNPKESEDKMVKYILEASSEQATCKRENDYNSLMKNLDHLLQISLFNMGQNIPEITNLKTLIAKYKEQQDAYIALAKKMGAPELQRTEQVTGHASKHRMFQGKEVFQHQPLSKHTWKEILATNYDLTLKNLNENLAKERAKNKSTIDDQAPFLASIDAFTQEKRIQEKILAQYPALKNIKENLTKQVAQMEKTQETAQAIAAEEKKLYQRLYSNLKAANPKTDDPCKKFIL
jgi:hypothetical protein